MVNSKGVAIKGTMSPEATIEYGGLINQFNTKAQLTVKSLHPEVRDFCLPSNHHYHAIGRDYADQN